MIEPIMFVGIGFLVAGLLVIGVIPLVHARAVRLTQRRLEALTPLSMAEIQADKDQLRAEFAMSTRRLEMSVEQMKAKTSTQLAEIGKKSEAIGRLKLELGEKTAALFAAEAKEKLLSEELAAAARNEAEDRARAIWRRPSARSRRRRPSSPRSTATTARPRSPARASTSSWSRCARRRKPSKARSKATKRRPGDLQSRLGAATAEAASSRPAARRGARQVRNARRPRRRARSPADRADHRRARSSVAACRSWSPGSTSRDASWPTANTWPTVCAPRRRLRRRPKPIIRSELAEAESRHRFATEAIRAEKALVGRAARAVAGRARQAAARDRGDEARGRDRLGRGAHGECRAARAHQRRRRRGGAADRHARGTGLGDRHDPVDRRRSPGGRAPHRATATGCRRSPPTAAMQRARSPTASAPCRVAPPRAPQPSGA